MSHTGDSLSREQRIRKQAELQALYNALSNLRDRELSYIEASAAIPELSINQTNQIRHRIVAIEGELLAASGEEDTSDTFAHRFYREGFEAELAGDGDKAIKLYKKADRYDHQDAEMAIRSLRYRIKRERNIPRDLQAWLPPPAHNLRNRLIVGVAAVLICTPLAIFIFYRGSSPQTSPIAGELTATLTLTPTPVAVQLIVPDTPTPLPTFTSTPLPLPSVPPLPTPTALSTTVDTATPTPPPTPTVVFMPAPKIIGPRDGLVWLDGAVVFEFEPVDLQPDDLYCLNTLRGLDNTYTENWSYPPTGNEKPIIAIQANVLRVAQVQGMQCIIWSAAIGRGNCDNIISDSTSERVIGLPRVCDLN
ncbi:MAG: hypothetical protein KDI62_10265 [Anaerolineae bacterium]|nr:hypothetical protein [Anaerolineae bacterium]MCB0178603.1 hypothetical protein [Anaerolineae bacterium]MCB9107320.1 hypothetical protein [Anaerolineales bacterium]